MTAKKPTKNMKSDKAAPIQIQLRCTENMKQTGGGENHAWNDRIQRLVLSAIPTSREDLGAVGTAVFSGMIDINPADPIEGMLTSQLVIAHEAALDMYRRAWALPPEHFEARCRYLQMADKAQRTLALLTERLDRHRGAGQQQITVKHVTVNADNAIVGDVNQAPGVGPSAEIEGQPHALGHAIQPTLWSENPQREPVPVASDAERSLPDARGSVSRRPERE
jgi:hypothetical protein